MKRKAIAILCSSAMAVGGMFLFTGSNSPSKAAVPDPFTASQHFAGYSTGTDVFVDAAKSLSPGVELANVNVGYSAAAANSNGLLGGYVPAPGGFATNGGQALNDTTKALGWGLGTAAQAELLNTGMGPLAAKLGDPNSQPLVATTGGSPTNRLVSTAKSFTHLVPNGDGSFALVSET